MKGEPGRDTAGVEEFRGHAARGQANDCTAQPVHEIQVAILVERRSLGGVVARNQDTQRSTHLMRTPPHVIHRCIDSRETWLGDHSCWRHRHALGGTPSWVPSPARCSIFLSLGTSSQFDAHPFNCDESVLTDFGDPTRLATSPGHCGLGRAGLVRRTGHRLPGRDGQATQWRGGNP
jgi:hypothetical protein